MTIEFASRMIEVLGWVSIPLFICSLLLVLITVERLLVLRQSNGNWKPKAVKHKRESTVSQRQPTVNDNYIIRYV